MDRQRPRFLSKDLNVAPWSLHMEDYELWLARSDGNGELTAVSLHTLGGVPGFLLVGLGGLLVGLLGTYPVARRYAKRGIRRPNTLEEALRAGETEHVEFKREVKETEQLLVAVTAFANAEGGTVFIGVTDNREVVGIGTATPEMKDSLQRRLRDSMRQKVKPSPDVDVDFVERGDRVVARVFVRASWQRHSHDGRYYVRKGSQSYLLEDGHISDL